MSRFIIRSVTVLNKTSTIDRQALVVRIPLGTNVANNYSTTRRSQVSPSLAGINVPYMDTKRVILEDSMIVSKIFQEQGTLLNNSNSNLKAIEDSKSFMVKDVIDKPNQASPEQLSRVADAMTKHLPRFFNTPHPFQLYSRDIDFIDNVRQVRVQGLSQYAFRLALVKLYYRIRYTSCWPEVLNLVKHPEESCIRIRWRIKSKPGMLQFMIFFYKFHSTEVWTDGVSTLHVDSSGKIYCHVCDNIDVDEGKTEIKKTIKSPLVSRGLNV